MELNLNLGDALTFTDELSGLEHNAIVIMLPKAADGSPMVDDHFGGYVVQVLYYDFARNKARMVNIQASARTTEYIDAHGELVEGFEGWEFVQRCDWTCPGKG